MVFTVPANLNDFESSPYTLESYPENFNDETEIDRANSFDDLVSILESGNRGLKKGATHVEVANMWCVDDGEFGLDEGSAGRERVQSLYTLVRKTSSLAPKTMSRLFAALCSSLGHLCSIITSETNEDEVKNKRNSYRGDNNNYVDQKNDDNQKGLVCANFKDAYVMHLYFLFSAMSTLETHGKLNKKGGGKKSEDKTKEKTVEESMLLAMETISMCSKTMCVHANRLWKFAVAEEDVISLPTRISYQILETPSISKVMKSNVLHTISSALTFSESFTTTIIAALVDLMHSFEHVSPLVAELCGFPSVPETVTVELLRDISRMNWSDTNYSKGVKYVAPFVAELAKRKPHTVVTNISLLLPHLDSEPYTLRNSIVQAIGHIARSAAPADSEDEEDVVDEEGEDAEDAENEDAKEQKKRLSKSETHKKTVSSLLDVLTERAHDISSFTRAAVLKAWSSIVENDALPLDRVQPVTLLAVDRLQDKTVMVRRSAMQLLTLLLDNNPFSSNLDPTPYKAKLTQLEAWLMENEPKSVKAARAAAKLQSDRSRLADVDEHEEMDKSIEAADQEALEAAIAEAENEDEEDLALTEERENKMKAYDFTLGAINFIESFEGANENLKGMLLSSNNSDVTEALRFFVVAKHFKLPCAVEGMKQALTLMWSSEASIRDEVLKAFIEVFIAIPGTDGKKLLEHKLIAHNLLVLAGQSTVSEQASIEEAIKALVKKEMIPAEVFLILWSVASKAAGPARSAAMLVLSMGASADSSIVDSTSRLKHLMNAGLGEYAEENCDWTTARSAAVALKKIGRAQALAPSDSGKHVIVTEIIHRLCSVGLGSWSDVDFEGENALAWFAAAEQALDALFIISAAPEKDAAKILIGLQAETFDGDNASSLALSRFFFVCGHIALKLLLYTEEISTAVKRANSNRSLSKQEQSDNNKRGNAKKKKKNESTEEDEDSLEAELGMAAAMEAETERQMADIAEKEIVGRGLLGVFGPLLVRVVGNENNNFNNELLQQSATLALSKFMCISNEFCEKHLPLLFSVLQKNKSIDTTLRANIVVALGDLAFRFPNAFEPYTPRLYACLHDKSNRVKRHTLMVLTHLILNDMIKVKGQVCEIAMCIVSEESGLRDMSKLVFNELSKRSNNPIYNLFPDIIGQLSTSSTVKKEQFRAVVSFLLNFITKEKQNEMLVEKLCHRFETCKTIGQKADLAFCLAQLKISDKSIKNLNDLFKCYKDALFDEDVFKSFMSILTKSRKFASAAIKDVLDDWEKKLSSENADGVEDFNAAKKAERAKERAAKREKNKEMKKTERVKNNKKKKKKMYEGESDEDEDEVEEEQDAFDFDGENEENEINDGNNKNVAEETTAKSSRSRRSRRTAKV